MFVNESKKVQSNFIIIISKTQTSNYYGICSQIILCLHIFVDGYFKVKQYKKLRKM